MPKPTTQGQKVASWLSRQTDWQACVTDGRLARYIDRVVREERKKAWDARGQWQEIMAPRRRVK